jgi:uncharacterized protein with GYD domain
MGPVLPVAIRPEDKGGAHHGGDIMPIYLTQGRFTREAISGMIDSPEDRAEAVGKLAKASGAKLLGYYLTFGESDFLVIMEGDGPVTDTMAALLTAGSTGGVSDLRTTVAVTSKEGMKAMTKAKSIRKSFRPAGQK